MVLAHELFDLIESRLGLTASPKTSRKTSEQGKESVSVCSETVETGAMCPTSEKCGASESGNGKVSPQLQELFRARDEALLRLLAAEDAEAVSAAGGKEESGHTCKSTQSYTTTATVVEVMGSDGHAVKGEVKRREKEESILRTTTTSMCSRCRQVMSVHPPLHSAYARSNAGQEPPYTNWTGDFLGYVAISLPQTVLYDMV